MRISIWFASFAFALGTHIMGVGQAAEPGVPLPRGIKLEELPTDPNLAKIVFVAGSSVYKPGEHEYIAGCAVLMDLVRQTPAVFPVLAVDWPTKPETFAGAKAVVFLFDGAEKHAFLKGRHLEEVQKLAGEGVGLVFLHQLIDVPKEFGEAIRALAGGTWEKGFSQRAHWVAKFADFPDHATSKGLTPFTIDDGYLTHLRFVEGLKGVTPQLKTFAPKPAAPIRTESDTVVAWLYNRADGGRSFTFTGGHLHSSFGEAGYRRYLVNGILWSAKIEIPKSGAPVDLKVSELGSYLGDQPKK